MSENMRLGLIVGVFALMGAGIFMLFSGGDDGGEDVLSKDTSQVTKTSNELPDLDFAPSGQSSDATKSSKKSADSTMEEDEAEYEAPVLEEGMKTVEGMKGPGTLNGVITMHDGSALPPDVVISLYYIHEKAETDASIQTLLQTQTPNEKGEYTFKKLPLGMYALFGNADGFTSTEDQFLKKGRLERDADLIMYPMGTITGIVQLADGTPVPDAHISVAGYQQEGSRFRRLHSARSRASTVTADETGHFVIGNLQVHTPVIQYKLLATAPGYPVKVTEELLDIGSGNVVIILSPGNTVSGTVVDANSQDPIPNIKLSLDAEYQLGNQETESGEDGTFSFTQVAAGEQYIRHEDEKMVVTGETNKLEVVEGQDITDLLIELSAGAMVAGRLYDKNTDRGISGVEIIASPQDIPGAQRKTAKTDAKGDYLIEGLQAGSYQVRYDQIKGYSRRSWDDQKNVALVLGRKSSGIDFPVDQGMTISGIVVDPDGKPIEGANINGNDQHNRYDHKTTDDKGRFVIAGFTTNSTVSLQTRKENFATPKMDVEIEETNVVNVRIEMVADAKISGIIVDTRGTPKADAQIFSYSQSGRYGQSAKSKADGSFTLGGLTEGEIDIKPVINRSWNSSRKSLATVTLKAGEHKEDLRLVWDIEEGNMTITGRVTDDQRKAIEDVRVYAHGQRGGSSVEANTDKNGDYTLLGLKEGSVYYLQFNKHKYANGNLQQIAAGSTNADVTLNRTGTISGRIVKGSSGEAVTDFKILLINGNQQYSAHMERQFKAYHHEEGHFSVEDVHPGSATLIVRADGLAETKYVVSDVRSAEDNDNEIIKMESGNVVTGTVKNDQGEAVRGAFIFIGEIPRDQWQRDRGGKATTNAAGEFTLDGLPAGENVIAAYSQGYASDSVSVHISGGSGHVDLVLHDGASVEGYVMQDGKPVVGANMYGNVSSFSVQGKTDDKGYYLIKGLPAGTGNLSCNINGSEQRRSMSTQIETEVGMVTEANFDFENATSIVEGYIMISETETSAGQVSLRIDTGETQESRNMEVGSDGYYIFEGVPAGKVTLNSWGTTVQVRTAATGDVGENETLRLDIKLYGGATVNLTVGNVPQGRQTYFVVVPGKVDLPATITEEALTQTFSQSVQSGVIQPDGTGKIAMLEAGQYTVLAVAYLIENGRPDFENSSFALGNITVQDGKEHSLNLSF